jgi:nucleotide-binding universal stress UspA family protein
MRRILVAVDETRASKEAVRTALEFAERLDMRVTFVHVLPERVAVRGEAPEFADFENACEEHAEELVKEACRMAQSYPGRVDTQVVHGEPVTLLSKLAAEADVDMVIVGARARTSLARTLLGTVSGRLMNLCPKPVMVVPERGAAAEPRLAAS